MEYKKIFIELIIVFIGVLGAFLVDSKIQSLQDHKTNVQTLTAIYHSLQTDTSAINLSIRLYSYKERKLLSDRFIKWLERNEAPLDSLELLLNHMTSAYIFRNLINDEILQRLPNINNLDNEYLKFNILDYYSYAKGFKDTYLLASNANSAAVIKLVDIENFRYENGWPSINVNQKDKRVVINKFMDKELKNRCLVFGSDCGDIQVSFGRFKTKAEDLLKDLKNELDR